MWASVIDLLRTGGNFGHSLGIQCPRHDHVFEISNPDDFSMFSPEGGCNLPCEWRLECGHVSNAHLEHRRIIATVWSPCFC